MKRILITSFVVVLSLNGFSQDNTLTTKEKKEGWKLLFDGTSTKGWRNFKSDKIGEGWLVKDGVLFLDEAKKDKAGNIVTLDEFENYELSLAWKISPCGNSGILFNVVEDPNINEPWKTGPEMQIIDDACHADAKNFKHRAGDLYDLIACKTPSVKPAGEWNTARVLLDKGHLELWLNDVKQVETTMFTPEFDAMLKESKFKDMPAFGKAKKGRISLQDHGNAVWFKNIKIREIK